MAWFKRFPQPISLPNGGLLLTLRDAAEFIATLPEVERGKIDWRIASEALTLAAERDGEVTLPWAAVVRALRLPPRSEP